MEIEKIVSTIQEKIGNTDFSSQTIQKAVELYPVAEGTEPDEAYFSKVATFLTGMQGQYNHDFSVKFKEAKKNLLTEDTFKDMTSEQLENIKQLIGNLTQKDGGGDDTHKELQILRDLVSKLTERLDNGDKAVKHAELLSQLKESMKSKKADDDYVLEQTLKGVELDMTKSIEDLTQEYLAKYDAEYLRCRGNGSPPRMSSVGSTGEEGSRLDQRFRQKAKKEGWHKD